MQWGSTEGTRAASSVVGTILLVAVAVVLSSVIGLYVFGATQSQSPAPQVSVSHELVQDGAERSVAVTLESGDAVRIDRLYVIGSKDVDIGSAPGTGTAAEEGSASERETFAESSGPAPQVGIGETWDSSETVYLDPVGSAEGVTITIYWTTEPVEGINPGTPEGDSSYELAEFTVD